MLHPTTLATHDHCAPRVPQSLFARGLGVLCNPTLAPYHAIAPPASTILLSTCGSAVVSLCCATAVVPMLFVWPGPNNEKYGHTKGVVGLSTDGSTGFWLVHSVPQAFAEVSGAYQGYVALLGV